MKVIANKAHEQFLRHAMRGDLRNAVVSLLPPPPAMFMNPRPEEDVKATGNSSIPTRFAIVGHDAAALSD